MPRIWGLPVEYAAHLVDLGDAGPADTPVKPSVSGRHVVIVGARAGEYPPCIRRCGGPEAGRRCRCMA